MMKKRLFFKIKDLVEVSERNLKIMRSGELTRERLISEVIDTCGRVLRKEMKGKTKKEIIELVSQLIVS